MSRALKLKGQKFGRLTVIERVENSKYGHAQWLCRCDCGNTKITTSGKLHQGLAISCGCLRTENVKKASTKHGKTNTRLFRIWNAMRFRCNTSKENEVTYHYKQRNIKVCDEWNNDFMSFYNWAIANGYQENLTIDRINVNGNYEPSNCRWVDMKVQANNKTNNVFVTYHGETDTLERMCRKLNVNTSTIRTRIYDKGYSFEYAVDNFKRTGKYIDYT